MRSRAQTALLAALAGAGIALVLVPQWHHHRTIQLRHDAHPASPKLAFRVLAAITQSADSTVGQDGTYIDDTAPIVEHTPPSLIKYWHIYSTAGTPVKKAFLFIAMILWLLFLFAFVGIVASEYFCINLNTLATRLGMSESLAGVTFLAFSNGSPDVFSTFSALKANSGPLAIGELLGAASFIVSVVAGTMCLITPFQVPRGTFLRDVGFFTVAIFLTLAILYDGEIHLWESIAMVALYCVYVAVVGIGSWWSARRDRQQERLRRARDEYSVVPPAAGDDLLTANYDDDAPMFDSPVASRTPQHAREPVLVDNSVVMELSGLADTPPSLSRQTSGASTPQVHSRLSNSMNGLPGDDVASLSSPVGNRRRAQSTASAHHPQRPHNHRRNMSSVRPSLLSAIEFRDIVNSLQAESNARGFAAVGATEDEGARGLKARERPGRAVSHTGHVAGPHGEDQPRAHSVDSPRLGSEEEPALGRRGSDNWSRFARKSSENLRSLADQDSTLIDLSDGVENPWATSSVGQRTPARPTLALSIPSGDRISIPKPQRLSSSTSVNTVRRVPSILLTPAVGNGEQAIPVVLTPAAVIEQRTRQSTRQSIRDAFDPSATMRKYRKLRLAKSIVKALFPSLTDWGDKSILGRISAVWASPALLVLNLTLPVVDDTGEDDCSCAEEKDDEGVLIETQHEHDDRSIRRMRDEVAHALHSPAVPHHNHHDHTRERHHSEPPLSTQPEFSSPWSFSDGVNTPGPMTLDEERDTDPAGWNEELLPPSALSEDEPALEISEWEVIRTLAAIQCTLAPVFCVCALFAEDLEWWYPLVALAGGLILGPLSYCVFSERKHPGRVALCFVGFIVSMVWILTIVNEVVGVLQAIGEIFGLSDAILGLTIFAMGNSLGDLVANATVARMGFPNMAIAACFGGPMLNILLGVGLSGTYVIFKNHGENFNVQMSKTLLVSGVGLMGVLIATLIVVPLNGYWMTRRWGATLICAYVAVLTTNILVEIFV